MTQITHLLQNYVASEWEAKTDPAIIEVLTARQLENEILLLPAPDLNDSGPYRVPKSRKMSALESYTPVWLEAPRLKRIASIVSAQATAASEGEELDSCDLREGNVIHSNYS